MVSNVDQLAVNTIRMLSIDQIEEANSGHPGLPMGAAPMAYELWAKYMKHNPKNPKWFNRDRFVLSAGHGSALLYSLLHLFGYPLSIDDLKNFRQWGSLTPGHPEANYTPGVEATTGPLGQGISTAVGMAMAEAHLAARFNRDGLNVVDHYTYVLCSDGDLMEGVSAEAASLAGHLRLGKLIALYDSNDISLDGELAHAFTESVKKRYESYGWHYLLVEDGNDLDAIGKAIEEAQKVTDRPTLIEVRTIIGYGSPNRAGTSEVHGKPLGKDEVEAVKKEYGWPYEEPFTVPAEVRQYFDDLASKLSESEAAWQDLLKQYEVKHPELAREFHRVMRGELPADWEQQLPKFTTEDKPLATRAASGQTLQALAKAVPELIGGSADLASSNNTMMKEEGVFHAEDYSGRNIWFGVREHAMGAALNGMLLHGGVRAYGGTFLVFSDYLRPSIRLAALSKLPVVYVFTHDSIAVGEDGPTHEPVEHVPSLRLIPGLKVIRPADANETVAAWAYALSQKEHPVALVLTRQGLPVLEGTVGKDRTVIERGAYVLSEAQGGKPDGIILATGSEVSLAVEAQQKLAEKGIHVRVVSMPCRELFDAQPEDYRESVLPSNIKARLAVEAAHPMGWDAYVGDNGAVIGIDRFGASAPGSRVMKEYGFHVDNVVSHMEKLLRG
ncbi:transketolase [Thermoactinomyces intermedius]|uniref:Transketolase n=1 Tax=Thermoactinomyces intermedius TaxID=2024 RepID=A0A8I1AD65_THEIN|nr:transketolase [Thermoactinomyces intermedius]MBA4547871.1 transketolase [Thermoactinomyces intermedius]MBA4836518.1 transketolase [Thermoactinomyces intermedius]MBH8593898.1 transketolase [Thermoactinomyces intermedius]MBH8599947.1 transketolase [Thermoactinomyces sp. CICC 23799]